jgi:hypothetical protein
LEVFFYFVVHFPLDSFCPTLADTKAEVKMKNAKLINESANLRISERGAVETRISRMTRIHFYTKGRKGTKVGVPHFGYLVSKIEPLQINGLALQRSRAQSRKWSAEHWSTRRIKPNQTASRGGEVVSKREFSGLFNFFRTFHAWGRVCSFVRIQMESRLIRPNQG